MLKAPSLSQRRAGQGFDDNIAYFDALALHDEAMANVTVNYLHGDLPTSSAPVSSNGNGDSRPGMPSQNIFAESFSGDVSATLGLTVAEGGFVEISGASAQAVTFTGTTGTLKLDNSLAFTGEIVGLAGEDAIDFEGQ